MSEAIPQIAEEDETPVESNPAVLLGLVVLTVGSAVLATRSEDSSPSDSPRSGKTTTSPALGKPTSAPMNGASATSAEAPQTAGKPAWNVLGQRMLTCRLLLHLLGSCLANACCVADVVG